VARMQINYPGMGDASLNVIVPQYGESEHHQRMSEEEFYSRRFPVLWLLHGEGGSCSDWLRFTGVERYAREKDLVVVCPTIENSFGINVGRGDPWEDFLTGSLRELIARMLPVSEKAKDQAIAGVSMGGYAALRLAMRHPDQYGTAGAFEPITALDAAELSYAWSAEQLAYVFGSLEAMKQPEYEITKMLQNPAEGYPGRVYLYQEEPKRTGCRDWERYDRQLQDLIEKLESISTVSASATKF